jgi:hypothetical protein
MKGSKQLLAIITATVIIICALPVFLVGYLIGILKVYFTSGFLVALEHTKKLDKFITKELKNE